MKSTSRSLLLSHRHQLAQRQTYVLLELERAELALADLHRQRSMNDDQLFDIEHDLRHAGVEFPPREVSRYDRGAMYGSVTSSTVSAPERVV